MYDDTFFFVVLGSSPVIAYMMTTGGLHDH